MWLPNWFYEMLPYLYVVAGFATASFLDTPLGYIAGLLLLLTGCLIWMMRRDYRQGRIGNRRTSSE